MAEGALPTGTVSFVFTDVEGSTRLWEQEPDAMAGALALHDEIVHRAVDDRGGYVFSTAGDAFAAAFARPSDAVAAAAEAQAALAQAAWPDGLSLRVRMGVHTGESVERDGDYFGPAVNRAARIMALSTGGRVLVSQATADLLAEDSSLELVEVGERHLRGLRRRERLFDVVYAGRPLDIEPIAPAEVTSGISSSAMLGRAAEIASVVRLLEDQRVVTLLGTGGIGKTTLALAVADQLSGSLGDGVWLVELAGLESGDSLVAAVAAALGVQPRPEMSLLDSIVRSFRDLDALVVLDNCEHVVDDAAGFVSTVVRGTHRTRVLSTSREPLAIGHEFCVEVAPLEVPRADSRGLQAATSPAVELFVERASEVGWTLDEDDEGSLEVVAEICRSLDGLPLGIELAAARCRTFTPVQILERLSDHQLLATRRRDVPERHRTLDATIDWSYRLLDDAERALFERLSVFFGGFSLDAAESVCVGGGIAPVDIAELVSSLVERSLIEVRGRGGETVRYSMLEPLRQFGAAHLDEQDKRRLADHHLEYQVQLAGDSAPGVTGPDEAAWVRRLSEEFSNLRVAHAHAVTTGQVSAAASMVGDLHAYAIWRQRFELGDWAQATLAMDGVVREPTLPLIYATAGWGAGMHGDYEQARQYARAGLAAEQAPGAVATGWLHDVLAHSDYFTGNNDEGVLHSLAEVRRAREADDRYRLAYVLTDGGIHQFLAGDRTGGTAHIEEGGRLARELQCPSLLAMAHHGQFWLLFETDPRSAREHALRVVELGEQVKSETMIGLGARNIAMVPAEFAEPATDFSRALHCAEVSHRAGDEARVHMIYQYCLPTVATLLDPQHQADFVTVAAGLAARPGQQVNSVTQRLNAALDHARSVLGDDAFRRAAERGNQLSDSDLAHAARDLYQLACTLVHHDAPR